MLTIKNKEALIGYAVQGSALHEKWVVDGITEVDKRDAFGPTANAEEYYVIKMQREDNNETKWIKLGREKNLNSQGPYYELSCGRQDGTGINRIFVLKETLENRIKLVNAIGGLIRMR